MLLFRSVSTLILVALLVTAMSAGKSEAQNARPQPPASDIATLTILTRTIIIALNQANQTGNYAVLREIGAPGFVTGNTPATLAVAFTDLRNRDLDLSPVVLFDPQFTQQPIIDPSGRLLLVGFFPTQPLRINFEFLFENVGGRWKLFGISVGPSAVPQPQQPAAAAQPQPVPGTQPSPQNNAENESPQGSGATPPTPKVNPRRFEQ